MKKRIDAVLLVCALAFATNAYALSCEKYSYYRGIFLDLPADQMGFGKVDAKTAESEAVFRIERDDSCKARELVYLLGAEKESAFHLFSRISFKYPNGSPTVEQRHFFSKTSPTQISKVYLFRRNAGGQALSAVVLLDYMIKKFDFEYASQGELNGITESALSIDHFVKRKKTSDFVFDQSGRLVRYSLRETYVPERVKVATFQYDEHGLIKSWVEKNSNEDFDASQTRYEYDAQGKLLRKGIVAQRGTDKACSIDTYRYESQRLKEIARASGCNSGATKTVSVNRFEYETNGTIRKWVDDISDAFEKVIYTSVYDEKGRVVSDIQNASSERGTRRSETIYKYDASGNLVESRYVTQTSGTGEKEERITAYQYTGNRFLGMEEHSKTMTTAGKLKRHELGRIAQKPEGSYLFHYRMVFDEGGASGEESLPLN